MTAPDAALIRARVCHPAGTPRHRAQLAIMTSLELRDAVRSLAHDDLVALIMALCTGMYPRIARDSVIAELARRASKKYEPE